MLFRKKIDRYCTYCQFSGKVDEESVICQFCGIVPCTRTSFIFSTNQFTLLQTVLHPCGAAAKGLAALRYRTSGVGRSVP